MKNRKLLVSLLAGFLALVMILSLVLSILPTAHAAKSTSEIMQEIEELQGQQDDLIAQMEELESQQTANWSTIEEMVAHKNTIDQQIALLHTEIININAQISAYSLLIAEKQMELDEAIQRLEDLNEKNKARIRAMEEEGKLSYWSVLFKANSFTDLLDRLNMIDEIAEADERRLDEMNAAAEEVELARIQLEEEKAALEASREELAAAQIILEEKRLEADAILAELNEQKRELDAMYEEYMAMEAEISASIAEAERQYTIAYQREQAAANQNNGGNGGAPVGDGSWYQPCYYVMITDAYGWRVHPITGQESFHNGVDMAAAQGTPIYAAKPGVVTTATYNGVYGYYVTINHGDGFSTLYGHMTNFVVSPGQTVSGGQLIGYMGSTGWSTGPHLHFTIYYNGDSVNPMGYV